MEKIETHVNKIGELLSKFEKENEELKLKGQFNIQQANYTMKRFAEELGSYFIKEIKACSINNTNHSHRGNPVEESEMGDTIILPTPDDNTHTVQKTSKGCGDRYVKKNKKSLHVNTCGIEGFCERCSSNHGGKS